MIAHFYTSLLVGFIALFPIFLLHRTVPRFLFGLPNSAYISTPVLAFTGTWICWEIGSALSDGHFNALWGLGPVLLAQIESILWTRFNLERDCRERLGSNRFLMANGVVIVVPKGLLILAVIFSVGTALALDQAAPAKTISWLSKGLHLRAVKWGFLALGVAVLIQIVGLSQAIAGRWINKSRH